MKRGVAFLAVLTGCQLPAERTADSGVDAPADAAPEAEAPEAPSCPFIEVAGGLYHFCGLRADGTVACWGTNGDGQLGDATIADRAQPVTVDLGGAAVAIGAGRTHSCAVLGDGSASCWGGNLAGQLGDGTTAGKAMPVVVSGLSDAVEIALGDFFTCARTREGTVWCWGDDANGQLADGGSERRDRPALVTALGTDVAEIAAGRLHACARKNDGALWCWGANGDGQTGREGTDQRWPVPVAGLPTDIAGVALGGYHTCVRTQSGSLYCWGSGWLGQLGDGIGGYSAMPVQILVGALGPRVVDVALGDRNTCAIRDDGSAWCWGENAFGQIGDGTTMNRFSPVRMLAANARRTALSFRTGCALDTAGGVSCWGGNGSGELGDGSARADVVTTVPLPGPAAEVRAGHYFACARQTSGPVSCWGANASGQVGAGSLDTIRPSPSAIASLGTDVTALTAGSGHACALRKDASVACWGEGTFGQLGDGATRTRREPVPVDLPAFYKVVEIVAGEHHSCARIDNGAVACWGSNAHGEIGDGTEIERTTPRGVSGLNAGVAGLAAGGTHSCARKADGQVVCWGAGFFGQLGNGDSKDQRVPVVVDVVGNDVVEITCGFQHSCARKADGRIFCWGDNRRRQLGTDDFPYARSPVEAKGVGPDVVALTAGPNHTCARKADGSVVCWGENWHGQLGPGPLMTRDPIPVDFGGPVTSLAAGTRFTCGVRQDGAVACLGWNGDGQLGDGRGGGRTKPAPVRDCR